MISDEHAKVDIVPVFSILIAKVLAHACCATRVKEDKVSIPTYNSEKCDHFQLPFSSKPSIVVAYSFTTLIKLFQVKNRKSSDISANQTQLIKQPMITQSNWRNRCFGAGKRRQAVVGQRREKRSTCFRAILILFLWKTQILISHWEALVVFVCFYLSAVKLQ